ncbi:MAG TPA: adenosine deaminase family protein [Candidatus Saccharimonadales bacterium]|nr:adenosine deaminase family protein [Candidatus Saccharimonadales bacterium]
MPRPRLDPRTPLTELHVHLGAAVTPAVMWGIAHAQGIRLPTKDYWAFRDLITVGRRRRGSGSLKAYLDLFHWTELIQSSPIAVERSVYEVIGGAYRKNNITRIELRFNPMKRNRGGEQDLDHIIAAAIRGMDRAVLEYPQVRAGLIFCLDRSFSRELNEIIAAKAIAWRSRGVVAVDIAGPVEPSFRFADYRSLFAECRRSGLGVTVHAGETGGAEEVREAVEALEPTRIGHGVKSAYDPAVMDLLRERAIVLEVCPTSNLNTRVVRDVPELRLILRRLIDHRVPFTLSTDGPEMLGSYLRDEVALLLRHEIMSLEEIEQAIQTAHGASFVDGASVPISSARSAAPMALEVEV